VASSRHKAFELSGNALNLVAHRRDYRRDKELISFGRKTRVEDDLVEFIEVLVCAKRRETLLQFSHIALKRFDISRHWISPRYET